MQIYSLITKRKNAKQYFMQVGKNMLNFCELDQRRHFGICRP